MTGCSDTLLFQNAIRIYPVPKADFSPDPEAVRISAPQVTFRNTSTGASSYEWDFGDNSPVSTQKEPVHRFSKLGYYDVTLTSFNEFNCQDSIRKSVMVIFDRLFPPNAFSPNSPNEVDRIFRIYAEGVADEGYQLLIYNRWGERIFETTASLTGWDGKMKNGNPAPAGVYSWIVKYRDFTGMLHHQSGNVTLLY